MKVSTKQKLNYYSWVVLLVLDVMIIIVSVSRRDWVKTALFCALALLAAAEISIAYRKKKSDS